MKWLILFLSFVSIIDGNAQKLKIGFRGGASLANLINHTLSGRESYSIPNDYFLTSGDINPSYGIPQYISNGTATTITNPHYETSLTKDMRVGFFAGLYADIFLSRKLNIEAGLGYVQKGLNLKYHYSTLQYYDVNVNTKSYHEFNRVLHSNYLNVPVVLKYKIDRRQRFSIMAGMYAAVALNGKVKNAGGVDDYVAYDKNDQPLNGFYSVYHLSSAYLNKFDAGFIAGIGIDAPTDAGWNFGFDLRINTGLLNTLRAGGPGIDYLNFNPQAKNVNIETGIRISRPFKKPTPVG